MNQERRMDEQSAKEAVKEVHPAAFLSAKGTVWSERGMTKIRLGKSWIDAASRLAPTKQPEPASDEFPKASRCGHCGLILDGSLRRCSNGGWCSEEGQPSPEPKVEPELQQERERCLLPTPNWCCSLPKGHIGRHVAYPLHDIKNGILEELSQPSPAPATPPHKPCKIQGFCSIGVDKKCHCDVELLRSIVAEKAAPATPAEAQTFGEWWNKQGRLFVAGDNVYVQRVVMGIAERAWNAAKGGTR